jgi:hypothetical protein
MPPHLAARVPVVASGRNAHTDEDGQHGASADHPVATRLHTSLTGASRIQDVLTMDTNGLCQQGGESICSSTPEWLPQKWHFCDSAALGCDAEKRSQRGMSNISRGRAIASR